MQRNSESRQSALRAELLEELAGSLADAQGLSSLFKGTIVDVNLKDVVVELGPRSQGVIPVEEFDAPPETGTTIQAALTGREDGLWLLSVKQARALASWDEMEVGSLVKGRVIGVNRGGIELKVSGVDAFMPSSQIALHHVDDLLSYAGQTLVAEVIEIDRDKRRVVVSRRAVLKGEAEDKRTETAGALVEGAVVAGKVTRLEPFGAFVDIGGVEGLLHVSNISHERVEHPEEKLKTGQDVQVQVLRIEEGGRRIGLGMKQLEADPWDAAAETLREDQLITGKVQRLLDFGAFIEISPGVDGLLHVSELGAGRVNRASDVLKVGEELTVRVLSVDPMARRISLSRLDPRGAIIGSEDAVDGDDIDRVVADGQKPIGTNLGSLFAALKKSDD